LAVNDALGYLLNRTADNKTITWDKIWGIYREPTLGGMGNWVYLAFIAMVSIGLWSKSRSPGLIVILLLAGSFVANKFLTPEVAQLIFFMAVGAVTILLYKTMTEQN